MREQLCIALAKHAGQVLTHDVAQAIILAIDWGNQAWVDPGISQPKQTPPWELWTKDGLLALLCGDEWAARFLLDIAACSHAYDDLIDKDKPSSDAAIHNMMWRALIDIPANPFFHTHQDVLRPVLATSILNWRAANEMEKSGCLEQLRISHAARYELSDVLLLCMVLTGGREHATDNARRARLMGQHDTWANYKSEHFPQRSTRC